MAYRNLHFRSHASDIRTESYLGEDHLVIPCIALVGDEVVYGMNADGPEFIPSDELAMSTLGWGDRPVLYDHPPASTASACEPRTLEAMSFGRTFFPRFEDNKLKLEAWLNKRRAKEIGQEELLASAERGDVIELSIGAIISLIRQNGVSPSGKQFGGYWTGIQSDHLAIGLSGSQGACNIEMGCGANRVLKVNEADNDIRTMRANRGVDIMPEIRNTIEAKPAATESDVKPRSLKDRILSLASQIFKSLAENEELSDRELQEILEIDKPCGCHTMSANETDNKNDNDQPKEDTKMADAPKKTDAEKPATETETKPPVPTPEKGSSEAATPSQSGSEDKTIPNYPAGVPNPSGEVPNGVTNEQLKALLEAHPVVKHYRAQEAKERAGLIAALVKNQKVLSKEQLEAKPIEELRMIADLVGVGSATQPAPTGDFSGRMMVAREGEMPPPPDPWGVAKYLKGRDTNN